MTTTPISQPAKTDPARDEIARRIFDEAICPKGLSTANALYSWLTTIEGLGGFLACSTLGRSSSLDRDSGPLPSHVEGIGTAIEQAAKICAVLAEAVERGIA